MFSLCPPAAFYLLISFIGIVIITYQNLINTNSYSYCVGNFTCDTPSLYMIYLVKIFYVIFWTWLLNLICLNGGDALSWFLVVLPFFVFAFIFGTSYSY